MLQKITKTQLLLTFFLLELSSSILFAQNVVTGILSSDSSAKKDITNIERWLLIIKKKTLLVLLKK